MSRWKETYKCNCVSVAKGDVDVYTAFHDSATEPSGYLKLSVQNGNCSAHTSFEFTDAGQMRDIAALLMQHADRLEEMQRLASAPAIIKAA